MSEIDKQKLIETFVRNFLTKEKRERCLLELKNKEKRNRFIDKLNHSWDTRFDMNKLIKLGKNNNDFLFIKNCLKIKDTDLCYIISNYEDIDDSVLDFKQAFEKSYGRGFATLIMLKDADKIYLETEVDYGQQNRFVGKLS